MQVKDSILTYIIEHKGSGVPVEAREIAEAFSIQRNMASHYLNRPGTAGPPRRNSRRRIKDH